MGAKVWKLTAVAATIGCIWLASELAGAKHEAKRALASAEESAAWERDVSRKVAEEFRATAEHYRALSASCQAATKRTAARRTMADIQAD